LGFSVVPCSIDDCGRRSFALGVYVCDVHESAASVVSNCKALRRHCKRMLLCYANKRSDDGICDFAFPRPVASYRQLFHTVVQGLSSACHESNAVPQFEAKALTLAVVSNDQEFQRHIRNRIWPSGRERSRIRIEECCTLKALETLQKSSTECDMILCSEGIPECASSDLKETFRDLTDIDLLADIFVTTCDSNLALDCRKKGITVLPPDFGQLDLLQGHSGDDAPQPRTTRILYADDDAMMRMIISRAVKKNDMDVVLADSGTEAIARGTRVDATFDAVILDYHMPGATGVEAAAEIAAVHPFVPIVLLSGDAADSIPPRQGKVISKHLQKPVPIPTLLKCIRSLVDNCESSRPLKILIVDDVSVCREVLRRRLASKSHELVEAENGFHAVSAYSRAHGLSNARDEWI
jgi:CheY-like chemotaxis protein